MSKPFRILGIAGSLRSKSYNRAALRAAVQLVPDGGHYRYFRASLTGRAESSSTDGYQYD
jgi:NAD(P)H-dependent FMN reductase